MSFLGKRFLLFLGALGVLFCTVYISFRCGYSQGLSDAPRRHYSLDVANALRTSPAFRAHVDSLYLSAYRSTVDSILRRDEVITLVGQWLDAHPGCQLKSERPLRIDAKSAEKVFFKGVKF